jgi:hypothetical protein
VITPLHPQLTPLGRRTRRPSWTPLDDPAVALWVNPADPASVALIGGSVAVVRDAGPAGATIFTTGPAGRPAYLIGDRAGRNALRFDGVANSLFCNVAISQPYTAFFVGSCDAIGQDGVNPNPNTVFELKDLVGGHLVGFHFSHFTGPQCLMSRFDGATRTDCSFNSALAASDVTLRSDFAGVASGQIYENGILKATDATPLASPNTSTQIQIGSEYGGNFFQGKLFELILRHGPADATLQANYENYFRTGWGTP